MTSNLLERALANKAPLAEVADMSDDEKAIVEARRAVVLVLHALDINEAYSDMTITDLVAALNGPGPNRWSAVDRLLAVLTPVASPTELAALYTAPADLRAALDTALRSGDDTVSRALAHALTNKAQGLKDAASAFLDTLAQRQIDVLADDVGVKSVTAITADHVATARSDQSALIAVWDAAEASE